MRINVQCTDIVKPVRQIIESRQKFIYTRESAISRMSRGKSTVLVPCDGVLYEAGRVQNDISFCSATDRKRIKLLGDSMISKSAARRPRDTSIAPGGGI